MTKYYLINYDDNYADEFDVSGHTVLNQEEYVALNEAINKIEYMEFYFGTNEEMVYESPEEIRDAFTATEISLEDYKVLKRLGLDSAGMADRFVESIFEQNEDYEDDGEW